MGACGCGQSWSDNESSVGAPEIPPTANCITVSAGAHAQLDGGTGKATLQHDTENLRSIIGSAHGNHRCTVVWICTAELMFKRKKKTKEPQFKNVGQSTSTEKDALCGGVQSRGTGVWLLLRKDGEGKKKKKKKARRGGGRKKKRCRQQEDVSGCSIRQK